MVVRAASQEEAARLFEHHPHFTIFPGPIRGGDAGFTDSGGLNLRLTAGLISKNKAPERIEMPHSALASIPSATSKSYVR